MMLCFLCGMLLAVSISVLLAVGASKLLSWILEIGFMVGILLFGTALYFSSMLLTVWTLVGAIFGTGLVAVMASAIGGGKND